MRERRGGKREGSRRIAGWFSEHDMTFVDFGKAFHPESTVEPCRKEEPPPLSSLAKKWAGKTNVLREKMDGSHIDDLQETKQGDDETAFEDFQSERLSFMRLWVRAQPGASVLPNVGQGVLFIVQFQRGS